MPLLQTGTITYFAFQSFLEQGVPHAIFTRHGGMSQDPYRGLNLSYQVGDDPYSVQQNRDKAIKALNRDPDKLFEVKQVHGNSVVIAWKAQVIENDPPEADSVLTNQQDLTLFMRYADCVPVMLYDPQSRVSGLIHAGWRGTTSGVVMKAVHTMVENFNSQPEVILAGIGPCIAAHHYQVGPEVVNEVKETFGSRADQLLQEESDQIQLDLVKANRIWLQDSGVHWIETSGWCTACHLEHWYSHRAEEGRTGRFGAVIGVPDA